MTTLPHHRRLRARDELILLWIKARCAGRACGAIAADFGVTAAYVRVSTCAALADDITLSGESPNTVRAHYWREE